MGIPEMGLPPVDPLIIPEVKLQSGNGSSINLDLTLTNLNFTEGIHFEVPTIDMNIKTGQIYLEILYPHLKMISDYKAKGRILLIQLESEGKAHAEFGKVFCVRKPKTKSNRNCCSQTVCFSKDVFRLNKSRRTAKST